MAKISLEIPADVKYLETVSACLVSVLDRGPSTEKGEGRYFLPKLAVHELCTNIIEHAYGGRSGRIKLEFEVFFDPAKIVIDFFDKGVQAEIGQVNEPNIDEPRTKGYGLFLIHKVVDKIEYRRKNGVNNWSLVISL
jgi:serine/threonine-protein kinase RsbW